MPKLVLNPGTPQAREFQLQPGRNYIGRGFTNDFRIEDPSVSVSHIQLILNGNSVAVKDLGSTNGTFIDRAPIKEAYLQPGQILQVGGIEMLFAGDLPASTVAAGVAPTLALPHPGQRIAMPNAIRPGMVTPAGGFNPLPTPGAARPAPAAQSPTADTPTAAQPQSRPLTFADVVSEAPKPFEHRPHASPRSEPMTADDGLVLRCLSFGLAAMFVSGVMWLPLTIYIGQGLVPYLCWITGIVCGLALKSATGNRQGSMFSLIATGCCLLGVFVGQLCRIFANQPVAFTSEIVFGLTAAVFSAWWIGGGLLVSSSARRERIAT